MKRAYSSRFSDDNHSRNNGNRFNYNQNYYQSRNPVQSRAQWCGNTSQFSDHNNHYNRQRRCRSSNQAQNFSSNSFASGSNATQPQTTFNNSQNANYPDQWYDNPSQIPDQSNQSKRQRVAQNSERENSNNWDSNVNINSLSSSITQPNKSIDTINAMNEAFNACIKSFQHIIAEYENQSKNTDQSVRGISVDWSTGVGNQVDNNNYNKQLSLADNGDIVIIENNNNQFDPFDETDKDFVRYYKKLAQNGSQLIKFNDITEPNMNERICLLIDHRFQGKKYDIIDAIKKLPQVRLVDWYYRKHSVKILLTIYCQLKEENKVLIKQTLVLLCGMGNKSDIQEIPRLHCTLCFAPGVDHYVGGCHSCYYCFSDKCFSYFCPQNPNRIPKPENFDPRNPTAFRKRSQRAIRYHNERVENKISNRAHWNEGTFYMYPKYQEIASKFRSLDTERAVSCKPGKAQPAVTVSISAPMLRQFEVHTVYYARIDNSHIIRHANTRYSGVLAADIESGIDPERAKEHILDILKNKVLILMDGEQDLIGLNISHADLKSNNIKIFDFAFVDKFRGENDEKPSLKNLVFGYCGKWIHDYCPREG